MIGLKNNCPFCRDTTWALVEGSSSVKRCECQRRKIAEERIQVLLKDWPEYSQAKLEGFKPKSVGQDDAFKAIQEDPFPFIPCQMDVIFDEILIPTLR